MREIPEEIEKNDRVRVFILGWDACLMLLLLLFGIPRRERAYLFSSSFARAIEVEEEKQLATDSVVVVVV